MNVALGRGDGDEHRLERGGSFVIQRDSVPDSGGKAVAVATQPGQHVPPRRHVGRFASAGRGAPLLSFTPPFLT